MTFYLGTCEPAHLGQTALPLMLSRSRLQRQKSWKRATGPWALDSGAFTELSRHGSWTITPRDYASQARLYSQAIGRPDFISPQDWMCEPETLGKTGLTLRQHQWLTLRNYLTLLDLAPDLPWIPVLQGWLPDDYRRHATDYHEAGIDLPTLPLVGLGSVCRRSHTHQIGSILAALPGLNLHGFGLKETALVRHSAMLRSSDSMAWSYHARRRPALPGCPHRSCANCLRYALQWRAGHLP